MPKKKDALYMFFLAIPFPVLDPTIIEFGPFDIGTITVGPFAIRWYALAYIAGLILGWRYIVHLVNSNVLWTRSKVKSGKQLAPATTADIDDLLVWVTLGVILGGRLGYVLFYQPNIIVENPSQILAVWQGGMSFHGGFLGVILSGGLFCYRRNLDFLRIGDLVAAAAPIGLFFGRIANFINSELWGKVSDAPWAVVFPNGGELPRHPSQLYEAVLEGLVLFVILRFITHQWSGLRFPGLVTGLFLAGYGVSRIIVEFVREPDSHIGYLLGDFVTMGMMLSLPMLVVGAIVVWWSLGRKQVSTPRSR